MTVWQAGARLFFLVFLGISGVFPAWAQEVPDTPSALTQAMEIKVLLDEPAENAITGRSHAMEKGRKQAFYEMLKKATPKDADEIFNKVPPEQIGDYVQSFEILSEKAQATHYQGELLYRFNEAAVAQLLARSTGIAPDAGADALLIIPLYRDKGILKLWEGDNFWRTTMNTVALEKGRGKLVMPFGDPKDAQMLEPLKAFDGDMKMLRDVAARYGVRNVVVVTARNLSVPDKTLPPETVTPPHIEVVLKRAGTKAGEETVLDYPATAADETVELILLRAAREIAENLAAQATEYSLYFDEEARQTKARVIRAEFRHSREWFALRQSLENLPDVEYVDVGAIAPAYAQLTLYFKGSDAPIREAILARGLAVRDADGYWVVSSATP